MPSSASYLGADTITGGSWKGKYGTAGYFLAETSTGVKSLPSWATVTLSGQNYFTYGSFNVVAAEPQKGDATGVFTSVWYSTVTETFEIDQSVATPYNLSVYLVDADNAGRVSKITITDTVGNTLDGPRTYSSLNGGVWARWQITGSVKVILTYGGSGANVETPGILFDPVAGAAQIWPYLDVDLGAGLSGMGV